jgi:hypothetical protein
MSLIAKSRRKPKVKRVCSECKSDATDIHKYGKRKDGSPNLLYPHWFRDGKGGWWCKSCYLKFYHRKLGSDFSYKGKMLWDKEHRRLRSGVCAFCGAKKGDINPNNGRPILTARAHIQYHDDDPPKDTIELCFTCHRKYDRGRQRKKE